MVLHSCLLFSPMMFLSGVFIPLEVIPETAVKIARFLPLTHLVALLRGLWFGEAWNVYLMETAVLVSMLFVCSLIVMRTFRWK